MYSSSVPENLSSYCHMGFLISVHCMVPEGLKSKADDSWQDAKGRTIIVLQFYTEGLML
jgi:hypothetical protein